MGKAVRFIRPPPQTFFLHHTVCLVHCTGRFIRPVIAGRSKRPGAGPLISVHPPVDCTGRAIADRSTQSESLCMSHSLTLTAMSALSHKYRATHTQSHRHTEGCGHGGPTRHIHSATYTQALLRLGDDSQCRGTIIWGEETITSIARMRDCTGPHTQARTHTGVQARIHRVAGMPNTEVCNNTQA